MRRDPVERHNTLLVASDAPYLDPGGSQRSATHFPYELLTLARATARELEPALEGGDVYTDDKAPVEWLVDKSIVDYAADDD